MPYKTLAEKVAANKRWRHANPKKAAEYSLRWRTKNPEKARAAINAWHAAKDGLLLALAYIEKYEQAGMPNSCPAQAA